MFSDFSIHRLTMIVVIGARVVNCCKGEVRIVLKELLRSLSVQQRGSDDRSDRNTSALDAWGPPTDGWITHNMRALDRLNKQDGLQHPQRHHHQQAYHVGEHAGIEYS